MVLLFYAWQIENKCTKFSDKNPATTFDKMIAG
jgi:hypothetical protein